MKRNPLDMPLKRRAQSKVDGILTAAGTLFREHGFGSTTMDAVAIEADVSKATLYQYFTDKRDLFGAVVTAADDVHSHTLIAHGSGQKTLEKMMRVARVVVELLLAPDTVATYRMVVAEAARFPELASIYYEKGAARLLARLEEFLQSAMQLGELRQANSRRAAEQFVGLIRGDLQLRALLGVEQQLTTRQRETVIRAGVDTFLRAYAAKP